MELGEWGLGGRAFKHKTGLRAQSGETSSLDDSAAKVELFLFQGQKGDPGLSPGKAHDGTKVGFQGPQSSGKWGSGLPCSGVSRPGRGHCVTKAGK